MSRGPIDYSSAGVDYRRIDALKVRAQQAARSTARHLAAHGMRELERSRGESAYVVDAGGGTLLASVTECLGTKALVADAVRAISGRTHYDTLAQDTVAMAVNDLITVGATPVSVHAYWAAGSSDWFSDTERMEDLVRGWQAACDRCKVAWGGGETPALSGVVEPGRIDLAASCVGTVPSGRLILGEHLAAGDAIVLLAASGIHANGVSLARKLAERLERGYVARIGDGRPLGEALLDPTVLYPPVMEAVWAAGIAPHYCVNVTGHGWRKIMRHPGSFTYRLTAVPACPPVLEFLQRELPLEPSEAYGSLNMGAGFALFVARGDAEATVRAARGAGVGAWVCGAVEPGPRRVVIEPLGITFESDELNLRA